MRFLGGLEFEVRMVILRAADDVAIERAARNFSHALENWS